MPAARPESSPLSRAAVPRAHRPRALALIALYKLAKAVICVVLAAVAFHLRQRGALEHFDDWLESLTWGARLGPATRVIAWLLDLGPHQFRLFGFVALGYAALYAVQGIGLWRSQRWAEYLVVVETSLLLPVEVWEILHRFAVLKVVVLTTNIAVVAYLIHVLRARTAGDPARPKVSP